MSPILPQLHWLPVKFRIIFQILMLTFKALNALIIGFPGGQPPGTRGEWYILTIFWARGVGTLFGFGNERFRPQGCTPGIWSPLVSGTWFSTFLNYWLCLSLVMHLDLSVKFFLPYLKLKWSFMGTACLLSVPLDFGMHYRWTLRILYHSIFLREKLKHTRLFRQCYRV